MTLHLSHTLHVPNACLMSSHLSSPPKTWARNLNTAPHCCWLHRETEQNGKRNDTCACLQTHVLPGVAAAAAACTGKPACLPAAPPASTKTQRNVLHPPGSPHGCPCAHAVSAHRSGCQCSAPLPELRQDGREEMPPNNPEPGKQVPYSRILPFFPIIPPKDSFVNKLRFLLLLFAILLLFPPRPIVFFLEVPVI